MQHQPSPSTADKTEFIRLQLEGDALLDLPDDHEPNGTTGLEDEYFALGREWVRYFFTGSLFTVREYMRPAVEPYADLTLNLADCVSGMARVLTELQALDQDELPKALDGVFRARRRARQENAAPTAVPVPAPMHPMPFHDRKFSVRLNAASDAIEALRNSDVNHELSTADASTTQKVRLLVRAWAVFYVTGLAHAMGGTEGDRMASIADQSISPDQCLAGLNRVRDRLTRLSAGERETAFSGMDDAYRHYVPEFSFTPA